MKKWIFFVILLMAGSGAAFMVYQQRAGHEPQAKSVQTEKVTKRDIASSVQATGVIRAQTGAEVKVGARISGRVEKLYANIGDIVSQGQLLAQIEQEDLKAKVNEAKMNLKVVEANLELARKNLSRMENLFAQDFVSRDKVDVAERDYATAQAQANQIRETIKFNTTQLSYADIHAPIDGVIASVATQQGETVSATAQNVPTFVTIVDLNRLEVYAYVDETDIGKIKPGIEATFTVDSFPDRDFKGKVSAIYPKATIQDNVIYYITLLSIENPDGGNGQQPILKPDMTVSTTLYLDKRSNVLAVPNRTISREGGQKVVQILTGGKPIRKTIRTGWKDSNYTEVVSGLNEGDLVIINDGQQAAEK